MSCISADLETGIDYIFLYIYYLTLSSRFCQKKCLNQTVGECFSSPSTQSLCYCLVYGGFFQQIVPAGRPKAQPIAVCHPDQKVFVKSLLDDEEEDDRVGPKALDPKALHPWHYPPVFLVDTHHPSEVENPGQELHWTERVEDKEKWNGVVFR